MPKSRLRHWEFHLQGLEARDQRLVKDYIGFSKRKVGKVIG
jgi:hypothetical protein